MPRKRKKTYMQTHYSVSNTPEDLIVDTTEKERRQVFEMCTAMGKYLYGMLIAAGALSTFLFLQCFLGVQLFSTPQLEILSIIAIGFIGIVNIINGLLLLAVE
jgi:hypothetical protein